MTNVQELVAQMTLEEKASLLTGNGFWHLKGIERLGIPSVMITDGPHGLRKQTSSGDHLGLNQSVAATCFPTACATACSFDRDLIYGLGQALGDVCQAEDVSVILGPGANIKRSPLCGRNFEYFSEDPFLSGEMAASHIRGVQSRSVGTSLKHFALNNQEDRRLTVSANVDERTMREIYLASFERAVKKGKPWTVMCSYNRVNGTYASENELLLRTVLRDEWGFDGYTMTDWGACNDHIAGVLSGMDLEMPSKSTENDEKLVQAVKDGRVGMDVIDEAVTRILTIVYRYVDNHKAGAAVDQQAAHRQARRIAADCIVLLKNENGILPLKPKEKIAFIGKYARQPRYQGGGSSHIQPTMITSAADAVPAGADVRFAQGFNDETDTVDQALVDEAVALAKECDTVVLFAGLPDAFESEGFDRTHLRMPNNQIALLREIAKVNPRIVMVLHNGAPVEMPWIESVQGLLEAYLGGQAVGGAVADVLFGTVNPSGKLAETFPLRLEDNPSYLNFPGDGDDVWYREGVYVGYRYYDTVGAPVRFPFGYGLSYTTFAYTNLRIDDSAFTSGDLLTVSAEITNTGRRAGKEIAQLYIAGKHPGIRRPAHELKGFAKVELAPGETKTVVFSLTHRDFAYYETCIQDWYAENGLYEIQLGASSRDIRLTANVDLTDSKPLVRSITRNSTISDLLKVEGAREILTPMLDSMKKAFHLPPEQELFQETGQESGEDTMFSRLFGMMPIRSLKSFLNDFNTDQELDSFIRRIEEKYRQQIR